MMREIWMVPKPRFCEVTGGRGGGLTGKEIDKVRQRAGNFCGGEARPHQDVAGGDRWPPAHGVTLPQASAG